MIYCSIDLHAANLKHLIPVFMNRVLSTGGGGVGGKVLPQTQHLPPQKFSNKNYSKCTNVLIMHAHTTLSIVYLSTVSIDTCCCYTGVQ